MNSYKLLKLFFGFLYAYCLAVNAAEPIHSSYPEADNGQKGLLPEQEFANYISERNKDKDLPELEYWGADGVEWGEVLNIRHKKDLSTGSEEVFWGEPSLRNGSVDAKDRITNITRHFAKGVKDRAKRLTIYKHLKNKLTEKYGEPTHPFHPETSVGGKDAYVIGVQPFYEIEWQGSETIVSLRLADDDLALEFKQSPHSNAEIKRENARLGNEFLQQEKAARTKKSRTD